MVAAEYIARLDETFSLPPSFLKLCDINTKEKYLEDWHLELLMGLLGHSFTFQMLLRFAWAGKHIGAVAWVTRSLLEIAVWTDYCTVSQTNARRLFEDAYRDSRDIIK